MKPQYIRAFGLFVGLMVVLGLASVVAGESLTDQQIGRQIEHRLSGDAFRNVTVSVHASVVSLSGTVPNLWAKGAAVTKARELSEVESVVVSALDIESAESDRAIVEQMASDIWRVSIPGPSAAARPGVSAAPGIAESRQPPRRFGRHGPGFGPDRNRLSVRRPGFDAGPHGVGINPHGAANFEPSHHRFDVDSRGFDVGSHDQLQQQLDRARYAHSGNAFYGIFDYVGSVVDDGVVALTGYVTHGYKANKMVEFVSRVTGVKEIQNQLAVLPSSPLMIGCDSAWRQISTGIPCSGTMPYGWCLPFGSSWTTCTSRWQGSSSRRLKGGSWPTSSSRLRACSASGTTWRLKHRKLTDRSATTKASRGETGQTGPVPFVRTH